MDISGVVAKVKIKCQTVLYLEAKILHLNYFQEN